MNLHRKSKKLHRKQHNEHQGENSHSQQGFVTDVVAQIILHHTADTKRLSVTSVKRKGIWPKFVNQRSLKAEDQNAFLLSG